MLQMYRGERIPNMKEQWTLAKSIRRINIKDGNFLRRQDWMYDSDDDFGENLGDGGASGNLDEEAQGEIVEE